MQKTSHFRSFLMGALGATLLLLTLGAANQQRKNYDVESVVGGLGVYIVDHSTNQLFSYRRSKSDDGAHYELVEKIDLSLAGERRIPVQAGE